jgi:hypothetical protein
LKISLSGLANQTDSTAIGGANRSEYLPPNFWLRALNEIFSKRARLRLVATHHLLVKKFQLCNFFRKE